MQHSRGRHLEVSLVYLLSSMMATELKTLSQKKKKKPLETTMQSMFSTIKKHQCPTFPVKATGYKTLLLNWPTNVTA